MATDEPLIYRLRKRAEIRRQISTRKSVQEGKPDRIADLLEEAATEIERLQKDSNEYFYCEQHGHEQLTPCPDCALNPKL